MRRSNVIKEGTILLECKELQKRGMFYCKAMRNFLFVYAAQSEKVRQIVGYSRRSETRV